MEHNGWSSIDETMEAIVRRRLAARRDGNSSQDADNSHNDDKLDKCKAFGIFFVMHVRNPFCEEL